jgi:hypothetical protein
VGTQGYLGLVVATRLRPTSFADAAIGALMVLLIVIVGTGLGLAAAAVQREPTPHHSINQIVQPFDADRPTLNRDRSRLGGGGDPFP